MNPLPSAHFPGAGANIIRQIKTPAPALSNLIISTPNGQVSIKGLNQKHNILDLKKALFEQIGIPVDEQVIFSSTNQQYPNNQLLKNIDYQHLRVERKMSDSMDTDFNVAGINGDWPIRTNYGFRDRTANTKPPQSNIQNKASSHKAEQAEKKVRDIDVGQQQWPLFANLRRGLDAPTPNSIKGTTLLFLTAGMKLGEIREKLATDFKTTPDNVVIKLKDAVLTEDEKTAKQLELYQTRIELNCWIIGEVLPF